MPVSLYLSTEARVTAKCRRRELQQGQLSPRIFRRRAGHSRIRAKL